VILHRILTALYFGHGSLLTVQPLAVADPIDSEQVHLLAVEIGECFYPLVPQYDYTLYQSVNPLSTLYTGDNV
jgi:hypothetical protein